MQGVNWVINQIKLTINGIKLEYKLDLRLSILQENFIPATIFMPRYLTVEDQAIMPSAVTIGRHST
jgi:hypothetical protein